MINISDDDDDTDSKEYYSDADANAEKAKNVQEDDDDDDDGTVNLSTDQDKKSYLKKQVTDLKAQVDTYEDTIDNLNESDDLIEAIQNLKGTPETNRKSAGKSSGKSSGKSDCEPKKLMYETEEEENNSSSQTQRLTDEIEYLKGKNKLAESEILYWKKKVEKLEEALKQHSCAKYEPEVDAV